jgi:hypothetical protein
LCRRANQQVGYFVKALIPAMFQYHKKCQRQEGLVIGKAEVGTKVRLDLSSGTTFGCGLWSVAVAATK